MKTTAQDQNGAERRTKRGAESLAAPFFSAPRLTSNDSLIDRQ
jgi:hypothetical protein